MSMTIAECFAKLDALGNDKDQSEQIFTELKHQIEDYELIDETMFVLYSARLFQAKAKFLRSLNNMQDGIKQEKLADLYQKKYEQRKPFLPPQELVSVQSTCENSDMGEAVEVRNSLTHLMKLFSDEYLNANTENIITNLELVTKDFLSNGCCQSLDSYMRLKTLADAIQRNSRLLHDPLTDVGGEFLGAIDTFNITIEGYLYRQRVAFAQYLLKNPDALFANVILLERNIESYTRKLAALFHTDKAHNDNDQSIFQELFVAIFSQKEILLSKIQIGRCQSETVEHFKKLGHEYWYKATDIIHARKGQWEKIHYLAVDSLRNSTEIELDALQQAYACQAYEYYRTACNTLGNEGNVNDRIDLRKFMALALYAANINRFRLEAQLYAIAAVHLLVEFTTDFSLEKFNALQKILAKIQDNSANVSVKQDNPVPPPLKSLEIVLHQSMANGAASDRRDIRVAVAEDKRRILLRQYLLLNTNLRIRTAEETILEAKLQATRSQVTGIAAFVGGVSMSADIFKMSADITAGIGASLGVISSGYTAYFLSKKSTELCEEPAIREELNEIFGEAAKLLKTMLS